MKYKRATLEQSFFHGDYAGVLNQTVDSTSWKRQASALPWIIGALSFLGRLEEAELLYLSLESNTPLPPRIECRFFLGIGLTRMSQYSRARAYFGANLRSRTQTQCPRARFFIYQGLSFYRYFSGRYRAANIASEHAFKAALLSDFLYGKVLSADLRGHLRVQIGEIIAGLDLLKQAQKWALLLGNRSVSDAIEISLITYRAQFGLSKHQCAAELSQAIETLSPQDTYSRSGLLMELARQQLIRGKPDDATRALEKAGQFIYSTQNRRHEVVLNLRYAYLSYLTGAPAQGLIFLRSARKSLDPVVDRALELEVLGMECHLGRVLALSDLQAQANRKLIQLSGRYGGAIQLRYIERENGVIHSTCSERRTGEDPLGEIRDLVEGDRFKAIEGIIQSDYLAFLYEALKIPHSAPTLHIDLLPGTLTTFNKGSVLHSSGLTPLFRALIEQLAAGSCSKKSLIENIWGYTYHPLRHDPTVYSAVTALRKLLGKHASWIETTEDGYRLSSSVIVCREEPKKRTSRRGAAEDKAKVSPHDFLNMRQHKILRYLEEHDSIDVKTCKKLFATSDITASRDLSQLTRARLVIKVGRARATQYTLRI